jgi:hypothetical protein
MTCHVRLVALAAFVTGEREDESYLPKRHITSHHLTTSHIITWCAPRIQYQEIQLGRAKEKSQGDERPERKCIHSNPIPIQEVAVTVAPKKLFV